MTKVTLSNTEMDLVLNKEIFLTKTEVIKKVYLLFELLQNFYKQNLQSNSAIPEFIVNTNAKISKGENYNQLPWAILDYPNYFKGKDVFAVRTFFWWGNFMSINFLVMGRYSKPIIESLINNISVYKDWYLCINENAWQHDFTADNFMKIEKLNSAQIMKSTFIKMAKKIPLEEWDNIQLEVEKYFIEINTLISFSNFQDDEKAL